MTVRYGETKAAHHFGTIRTVWVIAGNTAREAIRQPLFLILLGFGAVMVFLSPYFAAFDFHESYKIVVDLCFSSMLTAAFLISVVISSTVLSAELENRTALTVLAKPVSRGAFIVGKYLGVIFAAWLAVWILGTLGFLVARGSMAESFYLTDPYYALVVGWSLFGYAWAASVYLYARGLGDRPFGLPGFITASLLLPFAATGLAYLFNRLPFDTFASWEFKMHWAGPLVAVMASGTAAYRFGNRHREEHRPPTGFLLGLGAAAFLFAFGYLHLLDKFALGALNGGESLDRGLPYWPLELLYAPAFGSMHVMIVVAWAILFSTRMKLIPTTLASIIVLAVGHLATWMLDFLRLENGRLPTLWILLTAPLPNLDLYMINEWLSRSYLQPPLPISSLHLLYAALHALFHSAFVLTLAAFSFKTREIT